MEIVNWTDDSPVLEILKVSKYKKWLRKVINRFRGKQDIDLLMKRGMKVGKCFGVVIIVYLIIHIAG